MEDDPDNLPLWLVRLVEMVQIHDCRIGYCLKEVKSKKKKKEGDKGKGDDDAKTEKVCRFGFPQDLVGFVKDIKTTEAGQEFLDAVVRETVKENDVEMVTIPEGGEVDKKHKKFRGLRNHPNVNSFVPEIGKY